VGASPEPVRLVVELEMGALESSAKKAGDVVTKAMGSATTATATADKAVKAAAESHNVLGRDATTALRGMSHAWSAVAAAAAGHGHSVVGLAATLTHAFASQGSLGLAIASFGGAVGLISAAIEDSGKKAEEAREKQKQWLDDVRQRTADVVKETEALIEKQGAVKRLLSSGRGSEDLDEAQLEQRIADKKRDLEKHVLGRTQFVLNDDGTTRKDSATEALEGEIAALQRQLDAVRDTKPGEEALKHADALKKVNEQLDRQLRLLSAEEGLERELEQIRLDEEAILASGRSWRGPKEGLLEPGNINLYNRPKVHNADGTVSTVRSISFDEDGKEVLVPTVVGDKVVSNEEAMDHYRKTGEHLGKFAGAKFADAYAEALHEAYERGDFDVPADTAAKAREVSAARSAEAWRKFLLSEDPTLTEENRKADANQRYVVDDVEKWLEKQRQVAESVSDTVGGYEDAAAKARALTEEDAERVDLQTRIWKAIEEGATWAQVEAIAEAGLDAIEARRAQRARQKAEADAKKAREDAEHKAEVLADAQQSIRREIDLLNAADEPRRAMVELEAKIAEYRKKGVDEGLLQELRLAGMSKLDREAAEKAAEETRKVFDGIADSVTGTLADAIIQGLDTGFKNAGDIARQAMRAIEAELIHSLASSLSGALGGGLAALFGGGGAPAGGGAAGIASTLIGAFAGGGSGGGGALAGIMSGLGGNNVTGVNGGDGGILGGIAECDT
jgi:hypothetical protein